MSKGRIADPVIAGVPKAGIYRESEVATAPLLAAHGHSDLPDWLKVSASA